MSRHLRLALPFVIGLVLITAAMFPSAVAAQEEPATTAEASEPSLSGVYGWTATTSSGRKKGGTATIVDNGDTVSISTVVRKIPVFGVKIDIPISVEGEKVEVTPERVTIHIDADLSVAQGEGDITFTLTPKRVDIVGAGQGTTRWGGGSATITGYSHSSAWKPKDPPASASDAVSSVHRAVSWLAPADPELEPDLISMLRTWFIILFAIAMIILTSVIFGSAAPAQAAVSQAAPGSGEPASSGPTEQGPGTQQDVTQPEEGVPSGSPD